MKKNMGSIDRVIRVVLAVAFGLGVLTGAVNGALAFGLGVLAVLFLGTPAIGVFPLYAPFGISTCPREQQRPHRFNRRAISRPVCVFHHYNGANCHWLNSRDTN